MSLTACSPGDRNFAASSALTAALPAARCSASSSGGPAAGRDGPRPRAAPPCAGVADLRGGVRRASRGHGVRVVAGARPVALTRQAGGTPSVPERAPTPAPSAQPTAAAARPSRTRSVAGAELHWAARPQVGCISWVRSATWASPSRCPARAPRAPGPGRSTRTAGRRAGTVQQHLLAEGGVLAVAAVRHRAGQTRRAARQLRRLPRRRPGDQDGRPAPWWQWHRVGGVVARALAGGSPVLEREPAPRSPAAWPRTAARDGPRRDEVVLIAAGHGGCAA